MTQTQLKFETMSTTDMVKAYNAIVGPTKVIKKFQDRKTAIKKLQEALSAVPPTTKILYKKEDIFAKEIAEDNARRAIIQKRKQDMQELKKKKRARIIKLISKSNPRKAGTGGFKNWALYKDGMTVEAFLKAGGKAEHLNWDIKHKYITAD